MLRRSLLVSAVLLASSFGFAGSAKAGTETVNFTGSAGTFCNLGTSTAGTLGLNATNDSFGTLPVGFTASGTPLAATVPINCSKDATLSLQVNEGTNPTTGATMAATMNTSDVDPTVSGATGTTGAAETLLNNINDVVVPATVDLVVTLPAGQQFSPGAYSYTVVVTSAP
ncbi:hypothetical protein [Calothrix sp. PCC 6303]|uniref:hypothetical protein n=1 Tax=Calothrix sp. PCC 6303 TaxID=1170562 RepID=UPI0002A032A3|nr:hypothetical protein [Calothrix sp. PCC 6303]AFZ02119.1 hypothetical protein Cal6303_3178 [Calothrix sp. PCC 6303]